MVEMAAISSVWRGLLSRNAVEVDAFGELMEAYGRSQQESVELRGRSQSQAKEIMALLSRQEKLSASLQESAQAALRTGP